MSDALDDPTSLDDRLAGRLKALRAARGWSLDDLARASGVSRATLSRLEKAEVSPTAVVLNKLCAAYGVTLSRLMYLVEAEAAEPVVRRADQPVWTDPGTGFHRRSISPPTAALSGEAVEASLPAGARLTYDRPPRTGLEHHLWLLDGRLTVTVEGTAHALGPGDCLRYRLFGSSAYETPVDAGAHYVLFTV
jgi:transcriptional regulator with XRE-family HTH domain